MNDRKFTFVFELIYTILLLQHNTDGPNCETCLPDHWDVRWQRATQADANECKGQCSDGFMVGKFFNESIHNCNEGQRSLALRPSSVYN